MTEGALVPQRQESPLPREERGLELGSAPPWTQGALALDSVGRTSSEGCGLLRPHGTVTTPGTGRAAVARTGRVRAPCRVRSGILSPRVTEGQAHAVTGLGTRGPEPEYPIQAARALGAPPSAPGVGFTPEVRQWAGRVALAGPYVALLGSETRSVAGETETAGTWVSGCSILGGLFGTLRWGVLMANS